MSINRAIWPRASQSSRSFRAARVAARVFTWAVAATTVRLFLLPVMLAFVAAGGGVIYAQATDVADALLWSRPRAGRGITVLPPNAWEYRLAQYRLDSATFDVYHLPAVPTGAVWDNLQWVPIPCNALPLEQWSHADGAVVVRHGPTDVGLFLFIAPARAPLCDFAASFVAAYRFFAPEFPAVIDRRLLNLPAAR